MAILLASSVVFLCTGWEMDACDSPASQSLGPTDKDTASSARTETASRRRMLSKLSDLKVDENLVFHAIVIVLLAVILFKQPSSNCPTCAPCPAPPPCPSCPTSNLTTTVPSPPTCDKYPGGSQTTAGDCTYPLTIFQTGMKADSMFWELVLPYLHNSLFDASSDRRIGNTCFTFQGFSELPSSLVALNHTDVLVIYFQQLRYEHTTATLPKDYRDLQTRLSPTTLLPVCLGINGNANAPEFIPMRQDCPHWFLVSPERSRVGSLQYEVNTRWAGLNREVSLLEEYISKTVAARLPC